MLYQIKKPYQIYITKMARIGGYDEWAAWVKREYPKQADRPHLYPVEDQAQAENERDAILERDPEAQVSIAKLD